MYKNQKKNLAVLLLEYTSKQRLAHYMNNTNTLACERKSVQVFMYTFVNQCIHVLINKVDFKCTDCKTTPNDWI